MPFLSEFSLTAFFASETNLKSVTRVPKMSFSLSQVCIVRLLFYGTCSVHLINISHVNHATSLRHMYVVELGMQ